MPALDSDGRVLPGQPLPWGYCTGCRCPEAWCCCEFDAYGCNACGHWLSGCTCSGDREQPAPAMTEQATCDQVDDWVQRHGTKTPAEVCAELIRDIRRGR